MPAGNGHACVRQDWGTDRRVQYNGELVVCLMRFCFLFVVGCTVANVWGGRDGCKARYGRR